MLKVLTEMINPVEILHAVAFPEPVFDLQMAADTLILIVFRDARSSEVLAAVATSISLFGFCP